MCKSLRYLLVASMVFCGTACVSAQAPPCTAGTLANVLGTSCSVGALTLNFQNNFSGFQNVFDQGVETSVTISPAQIGFVPINQDQLVGFKLITNFVDGPGPDSTFSSGRFVDFSYTLQANPGFDIVQAIVQIEATAQASTADTSSENVSDFHEYPNLPSFAPDAFISDQNGNASSHLMDHFDLPAPALLGAGFPGQPQFATTSLEGLTTGFGQAALKSATFLYNVGPVGPLPLAALTYSNIDLPGTASTFASSITNAGKIAGSYVDTQGVTHGYVTGNQGGFATIDFPMATATFGGGLNNRGDLVGSYTDAGGNTHGFLLQDENFTTIDFPGATFTDSFAINDEGQIVGIYLSADGGVHGFLLDQGQFTSIDQNPANFTPPLTEVFGINNRGQIVGFSLDLIALVGLLEQSDSFQALFVPGQVNMIIESLNDAGDMVGTYNDINGLSDGFVGQGEQFRTVAFPDGNNTIPVWIDAAGDIVGQYADAAGNFHSFLAAPHGNGNNGLNSASNESAVNLGVASAASQPAPRRVCGSAEWRQHVEQIRNSCKPPQLGNQP